MCGGFTLFDYQDFKERFKTNDFKDKKSYNIRPSMETQVVYKTSNKRKVDFMRFGLIPVWAKDKNIGYKMINARSETIFEKPAWRRLAKSKRCVIPANGFYEWKNENGIKQPYFIFAKDQPLFSFAGLYDHWQNIKTNENVLSFSIITTKSNKEMSKIHDRMPVILNSQSEDMWLSEDDDDLLSSLLGSYENNGLHMYKVSTDVNSPKNQGKELIQELN